MQCIDLLNNKDGQQKFDEKHLRTHLPHSSIWATQPRQQNACFDLIPGINLSLQQQFAQITHKQM